VATVSAQTLSNCVDACRAANPQKKAYLNCVSGCEGQFMLGTGNTEVDDGKGGKVFTDNLGGKVFIDSEGGKVFVPPQ
jgi:hypothetical protein